MPEMYAAGDRCQRRIVRRRRWDGAITALGAGSISPRARPGQFLIGPPGITGKSKISAGVFDPAAGTASGTVVVPPEEGPVLAAAVTDEPMGGSPQPTGSILLLGKS